MPRKRKNTRLLQVYNDKRRRLAQKNNKKGEENVQEGQISEDTDFDSQEEENEENGSDEKEEKTRTRLLTTALIWKEPKKKCKNNKRCTKDNLLSFSDNLATGSLNTYSVSLVPSTHLEFSTEQDEDETTLIALYEVIAQLQEDLLKNGQVFTAIEYNERRAVYDKRIRILAKFYMHHKSFPLDNRGHFQKHKRFIDDEDIALKCQQWIRQESRLNGINLSQFKEYINNIILPGLGETKKSIGLQTARRWLKILGCKFEEYRKGMYFDGHERKDVITY
ncbi:hypothetical protein Glove_112g2 [Diversispora epigaea]|uniref:Uncharacterized protein n=1 Tax=Diversispora epigaea TaxID=1348612 RepID=A0A397J461_9GLOM|nr:hypothetical protein Glove_112g2 [Diversispora epigaea]